MTTTSQKLRGLLDVVVHVAAMEAKRERPILFSGPMVRAILEGRKSQTRRVVLDSNSDGNFKASELDLSTAWVDGSDGRGEYPAHQYLHASLSEATAARLGYGPDGDGIVERLYPRYEPGDRLWVRETWSHTGTGVWTISSAASALDGCVIYRASDPEPVPGCWWPSIHMPRWASRITLEITGVRVERLQDISEDDARAEGITDGFPEIECNGDRPFAEGFRWLWDSLNTARGYGWDVNPWVWVISFRALSERETT